MFFFNFAILVIFCLNFSENGRVVYKFDNFGDEALSSLGLTIDKKGYLYAATYFGGEVLKIDPRLILDNFLQI